ncbi:MAG TPA: LPXTG cell wall anchor domain-containing protein [Flavisolibacter sp.]
MAQQLSVLGKRFFMKGNYAIAAGVAVVGLTLYYFWRKRKEKTPSGFQKESERHHLTNAFARAKQVAIGRS